LESSFKKGRLELVHETPPFDVRPVD